MNKPRIREVGKYGGTADTQVYRLATDQGGVYKARVQEDGLVIEPEESWHARLSVDDLVEGLRIVEGPCKTVAETLLDVLGMRQAPVRRQSRQEQRSDREALSEIREEFMAGFRQYKRLNTAQRRLLGKYGIELTHAGPHYVLKIPDRSGRTVTMSATPSDTNVGVKIVGDIMREFGDYLRKSYVQK